MALDQMQSITNLLAKIKSNSDCCLKYYDLIQDLFRKIPQNLNEICPSNENTDYDNQTKLNSEDVGGRRIAEEIDYLKNIFSEKIEENSKLQALNERLLLSSREKALKIKELSRIVSLHNHQNPKFQEISNYKDKIGKFNVEIQKLKRQLDIETKKLNKEKSRNKKLEKNHIILDGQKKSFESFKQLPSTKTKMKYNQVMKTSFKDLDEIFIQKTLVMIRRNEEPNINDVTFDEPENLDFDMDEELFDESPKVSSDESLKEWADAEVEISSYDSIDNNSS